MKKIFLAFPGNIAGIQQKIKIINGFEFWNLKKINEVEFINLIRDKIKPLNKNIETNYFGKESNSYKECYKTSSWGMLLPDYSEDLFPGVAESLFPINLFSYYFLPVMFNVSSFGLMQGSWKDFNTHKYKGTKFNYIDKLFTNNNFIKFYKLMCPITLEPSNWSSDKSINWDKEEIRFYIVASLFSTLSKYQDSKSLVIWPKEVADIVMIYETLLSRRRFDSGSYKIIQRIEIVLEDYYKDDFVAIKKDLNLLYGQRNDFLHGSFQRIKEVLKRVNKLDKMIKNLENKKGVTTKDLDNYYALRLEGAELPFPDFEFLKNQVLILKKTFTSLLYINSRLKTIQNNTKESASEVIEKAIIDINLRQKIQKYSRDVLKLMPPN